MILTCIDSYLVVWKAYFRGRVTCINPLVGRKKIILSHNKLSRFAALALLDLFWAGIAKPEDAQTWQDIRAN